MRTIVVPVHLDVLTLSKSMLVKDAIADYTRLPYSNTSKDYNPDSPYLGEFIINEPFKDKNLLLKPGTHLHWSLPPVLCKSKSIRLIEKKRLHSLKHFFTGIKKDPAESWKKVLDIIWNNLLVDPGLIKPAGQNKASVMGVEKAAPEKINNAMQLLTPWLTPNSAGEFWDELISLINKPPGSDYPAVPNVWMVNRKRNSVTEKSWIVESNFISTDNTDDPYRVNVPFHNDRHDNKTQPFRFMGRRFEIKNDTGDWITGNLKGENYIEEITAVGYNPQNGSKGFAEPTFAAFYPNCITVFGLHDNEITETDPGITYEVLGLYSDPEKDYFSDFLRDFENRTPNDSNYFNTLTETLRKEFKWETEKSIAAKEDIPEHILLYAKANPGLPAAIHSSQVQIAIGNTGTEALSAYIASNIEGDKTQNEEILEAIQFSSQLQNKSLDIGEKFKEARHEKGFTAYPAGNYWTIKLESLDGKQASDTNEMYSMQDILPADLNAMLGNINRLQFKYDSLTREISYLRRQLYYDWYKYMTCAYPPVDKQTDFFDCDLLMNYIRNESINPLKDKIKYTGKIRFQKDGNGRLNAAVAKGEPGSAGVELANKINALTDRIRVLNETQDAGGKSLQDKGKCIAVRPVASPQYWLPTEPVLLFAEKKVKGQPSVLSNNRQKKAGINQTTLCKMLDIPGIADLSAAEAAKILYKVSSLFDKVAGTVSNSSATIWNPFMMEWKVEFRPAFPGSNEATDDCLYDEQYISKNYSLTETEPDFSVSAGTGAFKNANLYSGSTLLTPYAGIKLNIAIESFLKNFKDGQQQSTLDFLTKATQVINDGNFLSQSIGGFNAGLMLQKQTRQLDVADPLGFAEYQSFTENEVAPLVGKNNRTCPDPYGDFNPIRCGLLKILSLRIIDSFGQTMEFETPETISSEPLSLNGDTTTILLKPRLSQPARLNFRLLSAAAGSDEMNSHPDSSPVCGWLMPNNLDRSLMLYDQDGTPLGSITMNNTNPWVPAPDAAGTTFIDTISNTALRKVARYIFEKQQQSLMTNGNADNSFLEHFLASLNSSIENINPENFAEHQDLAVLMGRPVAVLRAELSFELEGQPHTDNSWTQLLHELQGHGRSADNFTGVKFPIRLGNHKQLNDGVVGYWTETGDGILEKKYYSSESGSSPDPSIVTYNEDSGEPINILRSVDDAPLHVTILADPTGIIGATTGILPVKTITIPGDQYKNAMKKIGVTFLTAPLLSPAGHIKVSLPKEGGYEWSYLEKNNNRQWEETPQTSLVSHSLFAVQFPDQPTLWQQLVTLKWLEPLPGDPEKAMVTTAVKRAFPPGEIGAPAFPADIGKRIDNFFDIYAKRIEPFDWNLGLGEPMLVREGWLSLKETGINNDADSV